MVGVVGVFNGCREPYRHRRKLGWADADVPEASYAVP